jgi:hypothetical protein
MAVQIEQKFPRCRRCGRMIHLRGERIRATGRDGAAVVFCSEICRDEYEALFGLADRGRWEAAAAVGARRLRA